MPVIAPVIELIERPGGLPLQLQLYCPVPPEALRVPVYELFAVPVGGSDAVLMVRELFSMAITRPPRWMYSLELLFCPCKGRPEARHQAKQIAAPWARREDEST